jgi:hypothetical protein
MSGSSALTVSDRLGAAAPVAFFPAIALVFGVYLAMFWFPSIPSSALLLGPLVFCIGTAVAFRRQSLVVDAAGVRWTRISRRRAIAWYQVREVVRDPGHFKSGPDGVNLTLIDGSRVRIPYTTANSQRVFDLLRAACPNPQAVRFVELPKE